MDRKKQKKTADDEKCKFCGIIEYDDTIPAWELYRNDQLIVMLNMFPYMPGHLVICPLKHVEDFTEADDDLIAALSVMAKKTMKMLTEAYETESFTMGVNTGDVSGRSIRHLHYHIVPRYRSELNFIDILGTRVMIETLEQTLERLKQFIHHLE